MADTKMVSFVLRFTQEPHTDATSPSVWRGMLRHVQTNEQIYFTELEEALAFITRYVDIQLPTIQTDDK
ncbi:MAG: hypothetical protein ACP5HM_11950 [Anaerolineae bacterium]